jgi:glutamyl-tRNA synthetase
LETNQETLLQIAPLIRDRIRTLDEAVEIAGFFFQETIEPDQERLVGKKMTIQESALAAKEAHDLIASLPSMDAEIVEKQLRQLAEDLGLSAGQLFGILRSAVTGQRVSPPLIESMEVIGKPLVLERIQTAVDYLQAQLNPI